MTKLKEQIDDYILYLIRQKGYARKTTSSYHAHLYSFMDITGIEKAEDLTLKHIEKYITALNKKDLKKKSQNHYLISLRSFLRWCSKNDIKTLYYDKIELASQKSESKTIELLDEDELKLLLDVELRNGKAYRDKAILEILFSTGLRVSELVRLNFGQIDFKGNFPVKGKGGKIRMVFLSERAKNAIWEYVNFWRNIITKDGALFINLSKNSGKTERLTSRAVQKMIKHRADWIGIKKVVTPHLIRHQFATDLLRRGANLKAVQEILGHTSITTTQQYVHLSNIDLEETHKKFHGDPGKTKPKGSVKIK